MILVIHIKFDGLWPRLPRCVIRPRFVIAPDAAIVDACKNETNRRSNYFSRPVRHDQMIPLLIILLCSGYVCNARKYIQSIYRLINLEHAIRGKHLGTVELLLRNNADPNITFGVKETLVLVHSHPKSSSVSSLEYRLTKFQLLQKSPKHRLSTSLPQYHPSAAQSRSRP